MIRYINADIIIKMILIVFFSLTFSLLFNHMTQKVSLFGYIAPHERARMMIHTEDSIDDGYDIYIDYAKLISIIDDPEYLLVDTRNIDDYDIGHIPGAIPFPLYDFDSYFEDFISNYPPFLSIILYCSDIHCEMALEMYYILLNTANFDNIYIYKGGYYEWKDKQE